MNSPINSVAAVPGPVHHGIPVNLDNHNESGEADVAGQDTGAAFGEPELEGVGMSVRPLAAVVQYNSMFICTDGSSPVPIAVHQLAKKGRNLFACGGGHEQNRL